MKQLVLLVLLVCMLTSDTCAWYVDIINLSTKEYYHLEEAEHVSNVSEAMSTDIPIATFTFRFRHDEIGTDLGTATILAKIEARKLGANKIRYISSTIYNNTETIATATYRATRSKKYDSTSERNDIYFIQNGKKTTISKEDDTIVLKREKFSLRFFNKQYNDEEPHNAKISIVTKKCVKNIEIGQEIYTYNTPYFPMLNSIATDSTSGYKSGYIVTDADADYGWHYLHYGNENWKTTSLISRYKDLLELEWTIYQWRIDGIGEISMEELEEKELFFIILIDRNYNGKIDEGELHKVKVIFKDETAVKKATFKETPSKEYTTPSEKNHITFIQNGKTTIISKEDDTIVLKREKFSLRFFNKQYSYEEQYHASIAIVTKNGVKDIASGEEINYITPYFGEYQVILSNDNGEYNPAYISDRGGHHYFYYTNENDRRGSLISRYKDLIELEWTIHSFSIDSVGAADEISIADLEEKELFFIILIDRNLNNIIDKGELHKVKVIFKDEKAVKKDTYKKTPSKKNTVPSKE